MKYVVSVRCARIPLPYFKGVGISSIATVNKRFVCDAGGNRKLFKSRRLVIWFLRKVLLYFLPMLVSCCVNRLILGKSLAKSLKRRNQTRKKYLNTKTHEGASSLAFLYVSTAKHQTYFCALGWTQSESSLMQEAHFPSISPLGVRLDCSACWSKFDPQNDQEN